MDKRTKHPSDEGKRLEAYWICWDFYFMEKEGFYFPHFSNARHDRKIKRLRMELGLEGYGIYFMLLETLRDQHDLRYPMEDLDLLADEFGTSEQKVRVTVCNYGLFDVSEDNSFFSPRLLLYLEPYFKSKQQRIEAGKKSAEKRKMNDRSTTVPTTVQQSKVNESKENKTKLNENKINKISLEERKNKFFLDLKDFEFLLENQFGYFFDYWTETDSKENMRFEKEKFFDIKRRINTWIARSKNNNFTKEPELGPNAKRALIYQNLKR